MTVGNSTFAANSSGSGGGGIYNTGTLTVSNSTFTGNRDLSAGNSSTFGDPSTGLPHEWWTLS